ncbi:MAG: molybdopterin molybdotransferase MoeA [Bacteroidia bacterium]|nr:molybdopterin molybdotransferase MoeA [Bacteroidia bacterium]MCX6327013.1 molybdopterin molybdotransferase MoeA [Bacteroidia bacterium]
MEIITFEEAYRIVLNSALNTGTETVSFIDSLNRVLAGDITSDMDIPPFNKATVDGFACRKANLELELEIIETIAAGMQPENAISEHQCSRIMTGAAVPKGADMVFMVEDSLILPSGKVKYAGSFTKGNISIQGEDIKNGDSVLKSGKLIRPQDIAVMASVGCISVIVSKMSRVAVISSGDELVEPSQKPGICQIRNTNAYQLMAQVQRAGAKGKYLGIARDDEEATYDIVKKAISECDLVLITGGVSMGDFDFVPSVLERAGVKILFSRVNIQPGKPTTFGVHPKALVFGLPGNPVSSFIQFELLVRPLIYKMMGYQWDPFTIHFPMKDSFSRKSIDRQAWIPVVITKEGFVSPVDYHGSAHISALALADGIIALPVGKKTIEKGEVVSVRQV